VFQSITARLLKKCPSCGKKELVRLIGAGAGIIFKGTGFYETDYRSKSYKDQAKKEGDAACSASKSENASCSGSSGKKDDKKKEPPNKGKDTGKSA